LKELIRSKSHKNKKSFESRMCFFTYNKQKECSNEHQHVYKIAISAFSHTCTLLQGKF